MNLSIKSEPNTFLNESYPQTKVNSIHTDISLDIESMITHLLNAKNILPLSVNTNPNEKASKETTCVPSSSSLSSDPISSNDNSLPNVKFSPTDLDSSLFDSESLIKSKSIKKYSRRNDSRTKIPKTVHKCLYCDFQTVMSQHMKSHLVNNL